MTFRFLTAGESHGKCLTAVLEGLPAGLPIDTAAINRDLRRRQSGFGRGGRMKIESDEVEIVSGVRFGETMGSPLTLLVRNRDWDNWQDRMAADGEPTGAVVTEPRPGHADLAGVQKYDRKDIRDILERASARETAARVAVGAVAKQLLHLCGIRIAAHVTDIGGVGIAQWPQDVEEIARRAAASEMGCVDPEAEEKMKAAILAAKERGDSLGGMFVMIGTGILPGLGSHVQWDRRLDARLAAAIMSIPAIKGVEVGEGFGYAALPGSRAHDEICRSEDGYYRKTNHAGGLEGGISNGEDIVLRAVMKPIPTLMTPLDTVDIVTGQPVKASKERSDVCAVTAAAVVGEAMMAVVLAEAMLEKFGGDTAGDVCAAVNHYRSRIQL